MKKDLAIFEGHGIRRLRDRMSEAALIFTALAELSTRPRTAATGF
jgi:hypothetical protein